jgi:hypothetical protein
MASSLPDDAMLHDPNPYTVEDGTPEWASLAVHVELLRGGFGTKLVWLMLRHGTYSLAAERQLSLEAWRKRLQVQLSGNG